MMYKVVYEDVVKYLVRVNLYRTKAVKREFVCVFIYSTVM
jgi:hypothetical protein